MTTDSQSAVVGGVTHPPHAQPSPSPCFHVSALPSDKQKSNCCYEVLHFINPIKYLSVVGSALLRLEASLVGCAGKSALVRFHKNSCVFNGGPSFK
jgi:hypothetical protein